MLFRSIGYHTNSGWWGTAGRVGTIYAILNEDSSSLIQTNANIVFTSGSAGGILFADGSYQSTAATSGGSNYSNVQVAAYLPTHTGNVQASNFNATDSGNMLNLITRNGDSNNSYAQPQITMGYAGTTDYPSFIHTTHNAGTPVDNTIEFWTCDGSQIGRAHV